MINKIMDDIIKSKGITNSFLSKKTGIKEDAISRMRLSKRKIQAEELIKMCVVLNVDVGEIIKKMAAETHQNPPM